MSEKRQHIVETAFRLFSENGFYATGIDQIIAESKTSKKTLYAHFESKNNLIVAVLDYYKLSFSEELNKEVLCLDISPHAKLTKVFEIAYGWYKSKKFNGCLAISAMNEFGNKDQHIADACIRFKETERNVLLEILNDMKAQNPVEITNQLFLVLEGMAATAHVGSIDPTSEDIRSLIDRLSLSE